MHHPQHHPLRTAFAEHATLTVAAAYNGAVMTTDRFEARLTCPDEGVRFGGYDRRVMATTALETAVSAPAAPAAKVVA